ncbi:MAG: peptidylprolyl isomerase [Planctomycetota bacterium]
MARKTPAAPVPQPPAGGSHTHPLFRAYAEHRPVIIGGTIVASIVVAVVLIVQNSLRASEVKAWDDLFSAREDMVPVDDLRQLAERIKSKQAGPWALYMLARREFVEKKYDDALVHLKQLAADHPDHYLLKASYLGTGNAIVTEMIRLTEDEIAWRRQHPGMEENPEPDGERYVIKTSQGEIVIGLYAEQAPRNCDAFRKLVPSFAGTLIRTASEGATIQAGEYSGAENPLAPRIQSELGGSNFPPIDDHRLFHFAGAVSFVAAMSPEDAGPGSFTICIANGHYLDDRQTVFAKVVRGLDVAEDISEKPKNKDRANELAEPVTILSVAFEGSESPREPEKGTGGDEPGGD